MTADDTEAALVAWIRDWLGRELGLAPEVAGTDETFVRYGMDSVHAMMLVGDLEAYLERRLPPTLAWTYPTVASLAAHLADTAPTPGPTTDKNDLLSRLDDLSEAEIDRLLAEREAQSRPVRG